MPGTLRNPPWQAGNGPAGATRRDRRSSPFAATGPDLIARPMAILQQLADEIAALAQRVRPAELQLRTLGRDRSGTGSGFLCGEPGLAARAAAAATSPPATPDRLPSACR